MTALGTSWEDERTSTAAETIATEPGLDYQELCSSWESHSTGRFTQTVTSLADFHLQRACTAPPAQENRFSLQETGPLTQENGRSPPPYPHTLTYVISTVESFSCDGTALFSHQAEKGSRTQQLIPAQKANHFLQHCRVAAAKGLGFARFAEMTPNSLQQKGAFRKTKPKKHHQEEHNNW